MSKPERFYYFTPTKYALEGVKDLRLKAAELDKANDPYELMPLRSNSADEDEKFMELKDTFVKEMKMICFSATYHDPSLWGHYASKCKGICLGFELNYDTNIHRSILSGIQYVEEKLDMREFGIDYLHDELRIIDNEKARKMLNYKSYHWKHEKEWRMWLPVELLELDSITGLYFFHFVNHLKLREILIGFRCEEENIESRFERLVARYSDAGDPDPPEIVRTRLSPTTFAIEKTT